MKKRILSILLSFCMVLCLMPTAAFAASTPTGTPLTQELIEREKGYNKDEGIQLPAGDYYLTDNVYLVGDDAGAWSLLLTGGDFTLDLNGYVLDLRGANICAFGDLTLKDSSTGGKSHKFRVEESGLWVWDEMNGTKTVDGGVITGGVGVTMDGGSFGGGVYVYSNLTMEVGSIVGCTAGKNGGGVDVDNNSANLSTTKFIMKGGSIENCTATQAGGGVFVLKERDSRFAMNGGSIENCEADGVLNAVHADGKFDNNTGIEKSLLSGINGGQTGAEGDPILIGSAERLKDFRDKVNGGKTDLCAKLLCDIVLNDGTFAADGSYTPVASGGIEKVWTPIGNTYNSYTGTFDGGGHTIKGLYVKDQQYAGLFGRVNSYPSGGKKSDFTIKDLTVTGYIDTNCKDVVYAGGIVGYAEIRADESNAAGTISGCVNNVVINARNIDEYAYAGGIVGYAVVDNNNNTGNMEIINCANNAAVTAHSANYHAYVGGIAGYICGYGTSGGFAVQKINTCFNSGKISGSNSSKSSDCVGGILGHTIGNYFTDFSVDNCLNVGEVTGLGNIGVGGIAGGVEKLPFQTAATPVR